MGRSSKNNILEKTDKLFFVTGKKTVDSKSLAETRPLISFPSVLNK